MRIRRRQPRHGGWRDRSPFLKPHSTEVVRRQRNQAKRSIRSPSFSLPPPVASSAVGLATEVREREGKVAACDGGDGDDQRSPTVVVRPFNRGQEVVGEKEGGREGGGGTEMVGSSNERTNGRWSVERRLNPMNSGWLGSCITNVVPIERGRERTEIDRVVAAADTPRHLK